MSLQLSDFELSPDGASVSVVVAGPGDADLAIIAALTIMSLTGPIFIRQTTAGAPTMTVWRLS